MSRPKLLQLVIAVMLVMLFLVGCGGPAATPVSEAPAATEPPPITPTLEPPTATPTPVPSTPTPIPPTETPTPSFANPQPSATFTGDLKSSKGTGSGTINFKVSDDGNSITEVEVKLIKSVVCSNGSQVGESTRSWRDHFAVKEGNIDGGENLKGKFTSPTEASGMFEMVLEIPGAAAYTCDFGTWEWSAKAKE